MGEFTDAKRIKFLELLSDHPHIGQCAAAVGVSRATIHKARHTIEGFEEDFQLAKKVGIQVAEDEVLERAVIGEPIYGQDAEGNIVKVGTKKSDDLLKFYLRAMKPKRYDRNAKIQVGDKDKVSLVFNIGSNE